MSNYIPPYSITSKMLSLCTLIGEELTKIEYNEDDIITPKLRKKNRVKTLSGTLEIEGNFLGEEKITAILNGQRVLGTNLELAEVEGAINAYTNIDAYNDYNIDDLLKAHKTLMNGILKNPGSFRNVNVGVGNENGVSHVAPPHKLVPQLMSDLFSWLETTDEHPLIKSSIFHYEFEFIHPFSDGNGRIGRLWQTLILSTWKEIFKSLPTESMIRDNQQKYYDVLEQSGKEANCNSFIEYMIEMILKTVQTSISEGTQAPKRKPIDPEKRILRYIKKNKAITITELAKNLKVTNRTVEKHIAKMKKDGKIRRLGSSRNGSWEVSK